MTALDYAGKYRISIISLDKIIIIIILQYQISRITGEIF